MTNIDEFTYSCESAKVEFQANVTSLLDLYAEFSSRLQSAEEKNKPGVSITKGELQVFMDWLMNTCAGLQLNYELINNTLKITNKLYKASSRIHLKDIAA